MRSSIAFLLAVAASGSSQAAAVRVYRCTGADGKVTLQDSPCARGQDQQLRTLQRPPEPPPAPPETPVEGMAPADAPPTDVPPSEGLPAAVEAPAPAKPLYECVTHDGTRYTNDTGVGETRWVPLWVIGMADAPGKGRTGAATKPPRETPRDPAQVPAGQSPGAGTWIRDTCYLLPPERVCDRLRAEVNELRRQRRQAQAGERVDIDAQTEQLSARLRAECR